MMASKAPDRTTDEVHSSSMGVTEKESPVHADSDAGAPYSVFHRRQLKWIIAIAAFAGWFSSASSFIYFPAIPFMARDLGISVEKVNLTVTSYLVASGIFPSVTGSAADIYGRKPVLIVSLCLYTVVNVALAVQRNFVALFVLRMVQSVAISGEKMPFFRVSAELLCATNKHRHRVHRVRSHGRRHDPSDKGRLQRHALPLVSNYH